MRACAKLKAAASALSKLHQLLPFRLPDAKTQNRNSDSRCKLRLSCLQGGGLLLLQPAEAQQESGTGACQANRDADPVAKRT